MVRSPVTALMFHAPREQRSVIRLSLAANLSAVPMSEAVPGRIRYGGLRVRRRRLSSHRGPSLWVGDDFASVGAGLAENPTRPVQLSISSPVVSRQLHPGASGLQAFLAAPVPVWRTSVCEPVLFPRGGVRLELSDNR